MALAQCAPRSGECAVQRSSLAGTTEREHRHPLVPSGGLSIWASLQGLASARRCGTWVAPEREGTIGRRLTKVQVSFNRVLDLRDASRLGLIADDLTVDQDWSVPHPPSLTQQLALAAFQQGAEGLIVPAASLVDDNLVVLIDNLLPASTIIVDSFIDPRLYVDRP